MSIASDLIRGHTDTIILSQLMAGDSYGYQINKNIQEKTNQEYELKEATLYSAFRRLEQAGYICSYWGLCLMPGTWRERWCLARRRRSGSRRV